MRIAINGVTATAGGARSYLLNLARSLPELGAHDYLLFAPASTAVELKRLPANFCVAHQPAAERSYAARLLWEQLSLPRRLSDWGADVLLCLGNFCPLRSPVPVLLLCRNSLYFTPRFLEDLDERGHWIWALRHRAMSRLALACARAARLAVTPTDAMADLIRSNAGNRAPALRTIPHGFELWPAARLERSRPPAPPPFRLLLVSHYNYYRNFETVLRAFARLAQENAGGRWRLILTTRLAPGLRLGGYDTSRAHHLISDLGIKDAVELMGEVPYDELPAVYASAHAVICPAYAESFSHTVVEAMAMGIPVIASDIPVHREVAGPAALFFSPSDPDELADRCRTLMQDAAQCARLRASGEQRARCFSWRRHFQELLAACAQIAGVREAAGCPAAPDRQPV